MNTLSAAELRALPFVTIARDELVVLLIKLDFEPMVLYEHLGVQLRQNEVGHDQHARYIPAGREAA